MRVARALQLAREALPIELAKMGRLLGESSDVVFEIDLFSEGFAPVLVVVGLFAGVDGSDVPCKRSEARPLHLQTRVWEARTRRDNH